MQHSIPVVLLPPSAPARPPTRLQVPAAAALAGLPPIALDRFDLHHGHLFLAPSCAQLGILFHAKVRHLQQQGVGVRP